MNLKVGDLEVLGSGVVTSVNGQDVLFTISENIKVRFSFTSSNNDNQDLKAALNENGELVFSFENFNNPLGTELSDAVEVGTYNGRKLLLHIRVLGMNNSSNRVIIYTWFLGNNINNG